MSPSGPRTASPRTFDRLVDVQRLPDEPLEIEISADPAECAIIAREAGIPAVLGLTGRFEIMRGRRGRVEVTGNIKARVTRECVVSLEPFDVDVIEEVEASFAPPEPVTPPKSVRSGRRTRTPEPPEPPAPVALDAPDPPDPIVDGKIDLGKLAVEFLILGLDPYPRKPGIAFEETLAPDSPAGGTAKASPFAVLGRKPSKDD